MNLSFDEQQEMMRKSIRDFLEDHYPVSKTRVFTEEDQEMDLKLWKGIADLGITGILIQEEYGGLGLTPVDQLVIQEEMGRYLTPAPVKVNALASYLLNNASNVEDYREKLMEIAEGKSICTIGLLERSGKWDQPSTNVKQNAGSLLLNGTKIGVSFAAMSHDVLVSAIDEQGKVGLYLVPLEEEGVSCRMVKTVDATLPWYEVTFQNVRLPQESKLIDGVKSLFETCIQVGSVFTCAESLGGMERILKLTNEYAKERIQFGKPIGSFQAIKHKLADMLVNIERAKALIYYASLEFVEKVDTAALSIASAKILTADSYYSVVREGIQIHGGMGFSWEHDMHLYLRRSTVNQSEFGDPGQHKKVMRKELGLEEIKDTISATIVS
ncbi:acyl-CoA dehydrogenase family protein [Neobacillus niacini]|uniref:acyl-CoA dehydrogenase family protein n=1 Tax=Neobacillus niacini TaxID=86668 RepID=UPI0030006B22